MPFIVLSVLVQVLCVVHIIRTGRNSLWLWAVVLLSVPGCIAYFFVEIAPELWGSQSARRARVAAVKAVDPERELRAARERLEIADSVQNRVELADALSELGRHAEALPIYDDAVSSLRGDDPRLRLKQAFAAFETGDTARALRIVDALAPFSNAKDADRVSMLRARVLEASGRLQDALSIYAELQDRWIGEEARCRYAAALIEYDSTSDALSVLEEVERRMRRAPRQQRAADREMYDWAMSTLARLRVNR